MGGGRVQKEIVPNSLYSLLFYFELFPKFEHWNKMVVFKVKVVGGGWLVPTKIVLALALFLEYRKILGVNFQDLISGLTFINFRKMNR